MGGSLVNAEFDGSRIAATELVASLPFIGSLVEAGDKAEISQFIDFVALCVALDDGSRVRATHYLSHLPPQADDAARASARQELEAMGDEAVCGLSQGLPQGIVGHGLER